MTNMSFPFYLLPERPCSPTPAISRAAARLTSSTPGRPLLASPPFSLPSPATAFVVHGLYKPWPTSLSTPLLSDCITPIYPRRPRGRQPPTPPRRQRWRRGLRVRRRQRSSGTRSRSLRRIGCGGTGGCPRRTHSATARRRGAVVCTRGRGRSGPKPMCRHWLMWVMRISARCILVSCSVARSANAVTCLDWVWIVDSSRFDLI